MPKRPQVLLLALVLALSGAAAQGQSAPRPDLYLPCEDCDAALEGEPEGWRTVIASPDEPGEPLILRGVVLAPDGATPVADVVVYAHHANAEGLYANGSNETVWSRRHGRLRAWARTGADGRYEFVTIKPAPYPSRTDPAHIHLHVIEPGRPPYWLDPVVFEGEFGVDDDYLGRQGDRGGSGVVALRREGETWIAERDIILERHPD
jgi:protocatechuate 3,4-dioxygenase beta subunit